MVRIGKIVQFESSRESIADLLLKGINKLAITGVNFSFVNDNTMHIYGEDVDLTALKTHANDRDIDFDILGDAPAEPVETPPTPPTQDEIDAKEFARLAYNKIVDDEFERLRALAEVEYDANNTTPIPFVMPSDFPWLRKRLR